MKQVILDTGPLVRMIEMLNLPVFTIDVKDFSFYRIHGRDAIPLINPD